MLNIITSFYISKILNKNNDERNNELIQCLMFNLESKYIKKMFIYVENDESFYKLNNLIENNENKNKVSIIEERKQPFYSDMFLYAITKLPNELCMISNTDIYIKEFDIKLLKYLDKGYIFSLTRYEYDMSCPLIKKPIGSYDCFIFKSPLNIKICNNLQIYQNMWGSENRVLYELTKIGKKLLNPCYQIKIVHLHKSNLRENNRKRVNNIYSISGPNPSILK